MALLIGGMTAVVTTVMNSSHPTVVAMRDLPESSAFSGVRDAFGVDRELTHGKIGMGFSTSMRPKRPGQRRTMGPTAVLVSC